MRNFQRDKHAGRILAPLRRRSLLASTALVAAALLVEPALAATDWIAATNTWADNANWSNNQPNAATDDTNITNGGVAQISTAADAGSSFNSYNSGSQLNVTNGSTVLLLTNGSLVFGNHATFENSTLSLFGSTNISSSNTAGAIILLDSTISASVSGTIGNVISYEGTNRIVSANGTTLTMAGEEFSTVDTSTLRFGSPGSGTIAFGNYINMGVVSSTAVAVDGGTLRAASNSLASLTGRVSQVTVASGATLDFDDKILPGGVAVETLYGAGTVNIGSSAATVLGVTQGDFSGVIQGAGGLRLLGGVDAGLFLTGTNTYTGGTTIDASHQLKLGNNGSTGSIVGDVTNNGMLVFDRSNVYAFGGIISGTGSVLQIGNGTTTLTGTNTYQGGTVISNGVLEVSSDANLGAATGGLTFHTNSGTLKFLSGFATNRDVSLVGVQPSIDVGANNVTLGGVISGTGGLFKDGAGALTLTNTNTYSGSTYVNFGTLNVNGSIASSPVTVANGGRLGGTGSLGATTVENGGALAPGNSIGTIQVSGPLTFNAGSYLVEVSPTTADRTIATGALTIGAGSSVTATATGGSYFAKRYTIIDAASRNGVFDTIATSGSFGNLVTNPHLEYDAAHVYFVLDAAPLSAVFPKGLSRNQDHVATAIDRAYAGGGDLASIAALFNLTGNALAQGLSQTSGEVGAGTTQAGFQSMGSFLSLMLDPFAPTRGEAAFGPAMGYAPPERPQTEADTAYAAAMPVKARPVAYGPSWATWASAYGATGRTVGDAAIGSQDTTAHAYGIAAGVDYRVSPDTLIGFALAGGNTQWSLASAIGSGKSDAFQAGAYAATRFGSAYLSAALGYGWHDVTTDRTVTIGASDTLEARFHAHSLGARLEGGVRLGDVRFGVTPYAAVQVQSVRTPDYAEAATVGAGTFGLSYAAQTVTDARTELGAWFDQISALNGCASLKLRARAAWVHDFDTDRSIGATFQSLPGASFTVNGAASSSDAALASAAAEIRYPGGWTLAAKFDGEFGARSQAYAGTGTVRYAW